MKVTDSVGLDQFETQKHVMAGTWQAWDEAARREAVQILVREAHKAKYDGETFIMVYDK